MSTLKIEIPGFHRKQAADAAAREDTSVDHIISLALFSQLGARQVRGSVVAWAARGRLSDLDEILTAVTDAPPVAGNEKP